LWSTGNGQQKYCRPDGWILEGVHGRVEASLAWMEVGLECWGVGQQIAFRSFAWRDECHGGVSIEAMGIVLAKAACVVDRIVVMFGFRPSP